MTADPYDMVDVPWFNPDPELIGHAEGNKREIAKMRAHAIASREQARRKWEAEHGPFRIEDDDTAG